jgi:hypothetical protein
VELSRNIRTTLLRPSVRLPSAPPNVRIVDYLNRTQPFPSQFMVHGHAVVDAVQAM